MNKRYVCFIYLTGLVRSGFCRLDEFFKHSVSHRPQSLIFILCFCSMLFLGACGRPAVERAVQAGDQVFAQAFETGLSDIIVENEARVVKILPDDLEGLRHQRFIVKLNSGQTVLIAHNIDVAPRVNELKEGDIVRFRGVYEWNSKGGTVHWTHHDPGFRHAPGWIEREGRKYQ